MTEVAPPGVIINGKRSTAARLRRSSRTQAFRNHHSSQAAHSSLEEFLNSRPSGNFFGDNSNFHPPRSTRILFQNVHGISSATWDEKQRGLFQCWKNEKVGISLLAEMNLNWNMIPPGQKWFDRVRSSPSARQGHYSSVSFNHHQEIPVASAFQWGGCSSTLLGEVAHSARSSGSDPSGLGRWSWVKLRGRSRQSTVDNDDDENAASVSQDLVVISAYRPTESRQYTGSVYLRQRHYWMSKGIDADPRSKFTSDLINEIVKWRSEGCEVILGIDANEDLSRNHPQSFRHLLRESGMTEAILARHHGPYPATQQSNSGQSPIDGIFISSGVALLSGGYLDFHQYFQSDHRGIWIDIDLWKTLGRTQPKKKFPARRLNTLDGRCVKKYLRDSELGYLEYGIPRRLAQLCEDFNIQGGQLSGSQIEDFNLLHSQAYAVRRKAEKKCRKFAMGEVPWSPELQRKWDRIRLLDLLLKGYKGIRTSSRKIR